MLVTPELNGVTRIVAEDEPSANATCVVDSEITDVSKPVRFNVSPPAGAGLVKDIVNVPVTPWNIQQADRSGCKTNVLRRNGDRNGRRNATDKSVVHDQLHNVNAGNIGKERRRTA